MSELKLTKALDGEDAFQVVLLAVSDTTVRVLRRRQSHEESSSIRAKREYYFNKLAKDIEALQLTYDGYVTEQFEAQFRQFHEKVEEEIGKLLSHYKLETEHDKARRTAD